MLPSCCCRFLLGMACSCRRLITPLLPLLFFFFSSQIAAPVFLSLARFELAFDLGTLVLLETHTSTLTERCVLRGKCSPNTETVKTIACFLNGRPLHLCTHGGHMASHGISDANEEALEQRATSCRSAKSTVKEFHGCTQVAATFRREHSLLSVHTRQPLAYDVGLDTAFGL